MSKPQIDENTLRTMQELLRQPPKPHDEAAKQKGRVSQEASTKIAGKVTVRCSDSSLVPKMRHYEPHNNPDHRNKHRSNCDLFCRTRNFGGRTRFIGRAGGLISGAPGEC